ncbi:MAG: hypothetical protein JNM99_07905 [Verrucomicrobiaceae bacterium]|nr:hypothetical protein [Verrucomicrobiaceae bacterium]
MNLKLTILASLLLPILRAGAQTPEEAPSLVPTPSFVTENGSPPPPVDGSMPPSESPAPADSAPATPQTAETAIPQTYRDDRYQVTLGKNPFMLKTKGPDNPVETFGKDWDLKSLREVKGKVIAGIQNRQTQEFRNISDQPDKDGFKLVKATIARNRKDSSAEVQKGSETATLTYGETAAAPGAAVRGPVGGIIQGQAPRAGAAAGMPTGFRPGQNTQGTGGAVRVANMPGGVGAAAGAQAAQPQGYPNPLPNAGTNMNAAGAAGQPAPPNPINRRRVLVPSQVPPTTPVP